MLGRSGALNSMGPTGAKQHKADKSKRGGGASVGSFKDIFTRFIRHYISLHRLDVSCHPLEQRR